jgi:hypothetical protein
VEVGRRPLDAHFRGVTLPRNSVMPANARIQMIKATRTSRTRTTLYSVLHLIPTTSHLAPGGLRRLPG